MAIHRISSFVTKVMMLVISSMASDFFGRQIFRDSIYADNWSVLVLKDNNVIEIQFILGLWSCVEER